MQYNLANKLKGLRPIVINNMEPGIRFLLAADMQTVTTAPQVTSSHRADVAQIPGECML